MPPNQSFVFPVQSSCFQLMRQAAMRLVIFGNYHQARSILVQTMHDAWTQRPVYRRQFVLEIMQESCRQSSRGSTISRMHDNAPRLENHGDIVVFVNNMQRHLFGFELRRFFLRQSGKGDMHSFCQAQILFGHRTRGNDLPIDNQFLNVRPRKIFELHLQKFIETFSCFLFSNYKFGEFSLGIFRFFRHGNLREHIG